LIDWVDCLIGILDFGFWWAIVHYGQGRREQNFSTPTSILQPSTEVSSCQSPKLKTHHVGFGFGFGFGFWFWFWFLVCLG
jgi:hypothetical protein